MANNNERRVWATTQIAPDPFLKDHLYVVQELLGVWVEASEGTIFEEARDPILSRVVRMKMHENGRMENVNSGSWEGRKPDGQNTR